MRDLQRDSVGSTACPEWQVDGPPSKIGDSSVLNSDGDDCLLTDDIQGVTGVRFSSVFGLVRLVSQ